MTDVNVLSAADRKMCHASIRAGSKSFHAASLMLPPKARLAARSLYAFCRSSDDLVDDGDADGQAAQRLRKRLNLIYQGQPVDLVCDRAYAYAVSKYGIPREIPEALIEGFEWDEAGRDYHTIDDLLDYAARVASTVGVMMSVVMGCRDPHGLARAADLGLAMQLTNIARDVGEDARNGRIYLPSEWLKQEGVDLQTLSTEPVFTKELGHVVERLLAQADIFYKRALIGIGVLPLDCRPAIRSAGLIYQAIGKEIRKNGFNSIDQRARTSKRKKLELMAYATITPFPMMPVSTEAAHRSVQFLVDVSAHKIAPPIKGIDAKAGRMIELLGKSIEHQNRVAQNTKHQNRALNEHV